MNGVRDDARSAQSPSILRSDRQAFGKSVQNTRAVHKVAGESAQVLRRAGPLCEVRTPPTCGSGRLLKNKTGMQQLNFEWTALGDEAQFTCQMDMPGRDACDAQIVEVAGWLKSNLKPREYVFAASRRDTVVTEEVLRVERGRVVGEGGTVFAPWRLDIDIRMPIRAGAMFSMAFDARLKNR